MFVCELFCNFDCHSIIFYMPNLYFLNGKLLNLGIMGQIMKQGKPIKKRVINFLHENGNKCKKINT